MHENTTRLIRDTNINPVGSESATSALILPEEAEPLVYDEKTLLSPLIGTVIKRPSIDQRLKEALKPVIHDAGVLKPERYYSLSKDAHEALCRQLRTERSEETMEVLSDLIDLLKENMDLTSLFNQNMNNVCKA